MELTGIDEVYYYNLKKKTHTRKIKIIFTNGVFDKCIFDFQTGMYGYDREDWRQLVEIEKEISRLEADYKKKNIDEIVEVVDKL